MSERRLLFVSQDAGGTVPPLLSVAQASRRRGHDVTVLGQPSIGPAATGIGARFVPFTTIPDYDADKTIEEDQLPLAMRVIAGDGPAEDVLRTAREFRVDLVVVDCNLASAAAAAEKLNRPSVILLHAMYKTRVDMWFADLWPLLAGVINATRQAYALDPVSSWADLFSRHDRIYSAVPQALDAPVDSVPATMRHFGFLIPDTESSRPAALFPEGEGKTVLISLSTTYQRQERLLQTMVDAVADLDVRCLVTTGGYGATLRAPANVVVREFVPHPAVLPQTNAVVTHGGLGTVAAALSHGVPLVIAPIARDQPLNAQRVAAVGAGVDVGVEPTVDDVTSGLTGVLENGSYRQAAQAVAQASAAGGGPNAAAQDLEALIA